MVIGITGLNNSIGPIVRNCPKLTEVARQTRILKIRATNVFLRQPYVLLIVRGVLQCNCHLVLNQLLFMVSVIPSPLYLLWLYDQLGVEPS